MRRLSVLAVAVLAAVLAGCGSGSCQTGTPHGNKVTATACSGCVSYNVYRCAGTCTTASVFTMVNSQALSTPNFLDPASGLTVGNTYTYAMTGVNATGNESVFSNLATVTDTTFPSNPNPPSGCAVTEQ